MLFFVFLNSQLCTCLPCSYRYHNHYSCTVFWLGDHKAEWAVHHRKHRPQDLEVSIIFLHSHHQTLVINSEIWVEEFQKHINSCRKHVNYIMRLYKIWELIKLMCLESHQQILTWCQLDHMGGIILCQDESNQWHPNAPRLFQLIKNTSCCNILAPSRYHLKL